jgi:type VI protein secretion system component VasK
MFILHFLPDSLILWFCNILLLAGVAATIAGFFAHRIPLISQYQLPFKVLGIALLVLGVYFRGGLAVETEWRERVAAVEARLAEAEKASAEANAQIDSKTQKQTTEIRQRMTYIRQYVDREVVKYNDQCVIPPPFIDAHNRAAEAPTK